MPESLPRATIRRLPRYLRALEATTDRESISSEELAAAAFTNAAIVRRDLSMLGFSGIRGVGYDVDRLRAHIRAELGLTADVSVAVVGAGNLGRALASMRFRPPGIPGRGPLRHRPRRSARTSAGSVSLDELVEDGRREPHRHRHHRRSRCRRPGGGRPPGRSRGPFDPQLRPDEGGCGGRRRGAPGRPGHRAADPELLPLPRLARIRRPCRPIRSRNGSWRRRGARGRLLGRRPAV